MDWGTVTLERATDQERIGTVVAGGVLFLALDVIYERAALSCCGAVAPWAATATWIHFTHPRFKTILERRLDDMLQTQQLSRRQDLIALGLQFFSLAQSADETTHMQSIWGRAVNSAGETVDLAALCPPFTGWEGVLNRTVFAWDESRRATQDVGILLQNARGTRVIHMVALRRPVGRGVGQVSITNRDIAAVRSFTVSNALIQAYFG